MAPGSAFSPLGEAVRAFREGKEDLHCDSIYDLSVVIIERRIEEIAFLRCPEAMRVYSIGEEITDWRLRVWLETTFESLDRNHLCCNRFPISPMKEWWLIRSERRVVHRCETSSLPFESHSRREDCWSLVFRSENYSSREFEEWSSLLLGKSSAQISRCRFSINWHGSDHSLPFSSCSRSIVAKIPFLVKIAQEHLFQQRIFSNFVDKMGTAAFYCPSDILASLFTWGQSFNWQKQRNHDWRTMLP